MKCFLTIIYFKDRSIGFIIPIEEKLALIIIAVDTLDNDRYI
jgi:hypothetical protein